MKIFPVFLLIISPLFPLLADQMEFTPEGTLKFGGIEFRLVEYYQCSEDRTVDTVQRKKAVIPEPGYPKYENGIFRMKGTCRSRHNRIPVEKSFSFDLEIKRIRPDAVDYKVRLFPAEGTWNHWFFLSADFPVADFSGRDFSADGKKFRFFIRKPEKNIWPMPSKKVKELTMPCLYGSMTLSTEQYAMMLQDNRKWGGNHFSLRVTFPRINDREYGGTIRFVYRPPQAVTLDLSSVMNRGFADEIDGDRKGGWTDQGKENDFRIFQARPMRFFGIPFHPLAPEKNHGKSCLVMSGTQRPYFTDRAEVVLPASAGGKRFLYLLHSAAWVSLGDVTGYLDIVYQDGSGETLTVKTNRDVANWWGDSRYENVRNVWQKENRSSVVGLGMSCFELRNSNPAKLIFRRGNGPVWMILAATLAEERVSMRQEILPYIVTAGSSYIPIEHNRPIRKGSVMDFSGSLEKPAGKWGQIIVSPDGHLAFSKAPGRRIRLYGVNLCNTAAMPETREDAEKLADELSRMGYNSVRLHHIDRWVYSEGKWNEKALDRMDYLVHCLKERGVYITYDLFSARSFFNRQRSDLPQNAMTIRVLSPFDRDVYASWEDYARRLLSHRNPYTGFSWAEDPVFAFLCMVNENTLSKAWDSCGNMPDGPIQRIVRKEFERWLKLRNLDSRKNREVYNNPLFREFCSEAHQRTAKKMMRFIREEMKCRTLITDQNWGSEFQDAPARRNLDLVDMHTYYNHPGWGKGPGGLPVRFITGESSLRKPGSESFANRIFGKPMSFTEIQFVSPNPCRMESGPLIGAYFALQDLDAVYRFDWSEGNWELKKPFGIISFSTCNDQSNRLADLIANHLFRRGDAAPAEKAFAIRLQNDMPLWKKQRFAPFKQLSMLSRIGYVTEENTPEGIEIIDPADTKYNHLEQLTRFISDTGEITIDSAARTMTVVTPKTECAVLSGREIRCGRLAASNAEGFQVLAAISRDNLPLDSSRRILFLQITDTKNSLQTFENNSLRLMLSYGKLPILAKVVHAEISLALSRGAWKVSAVDFDGSVKKTIPSRFRDGKLSFRADTRTSMIYELVRLD